MCLNNFLFEYIKTQYEKCLCDEGLQEVLRKNKNNNEKIYDF